MNTFMLSFTSSTGNLNRQGIQNFLDTLPEVLNWFGAMPNTLIIISNAHVRHLTKLLTERFKDDITFLITPINPQEMDGFINKATWDFINNPKPSNWISN